MVGVDEIWLTPDRNKWQALLKAVMKFFGSIKFEKFLRLAKELLTYQLVS